MKTYFLCLTQYENVGDLLINKMLIEEFAKFGLVYLDCPHAPDDFRRFLFQHKNVIDVNKKFGLSIKKTNIISVLYFLRKQKIKLFLQSPGPIKPNSRGISHLYFRFIHCMLRLIDVPFCRVGNCCSTIASRGQRAYFNDTTAIYVRSYDSVKYIKTLGFQNVSYIPDLAFLFKNRIPVFPKKKIAVLSFRKVKTDENKFIDWLRLCIDNLLHNGYNVELVFQVKKDEAFTRSIYNQIKSENVKFVDELLWYDSLDYYADKSIVISNRLHSLLIGAVYGAVPLAYIDGDDMTSKIYDVFNSAITNYELYITNSEDIAKLDNIISNIDELKKSILDDCSVNAGMCINSINEIVNSLK